VRCAFVFRRDLRLYDNTGLMLAGEECNEVIPIFFLDPRQVEDNPYLSPRALEFMLQSLENLDEELQDLGSRLHVVKAIPEALIGKIQVEAVYLNYDYTPFSRARDEGMKEALRAKGKKLISSEDLLLTGRDFFEREGPFTVFTHFYRRAKALKVREPKDELPRNLGVMESLPGVEVLKGLRRQEILFKGGRKEALKILERAKSINYEQRDHPYLDQTTHLSPYIKFGVLSIREVFHNLDREDLRRQLYWRDFYTLLAHYNPQVFRGPFKREYYCVRWENDPVKLEAWKEGRTGYPIVDAGMRELKSTGYINGRVRLLVSSFLVKILHVDWRIGERYFATQLVDYDPSVNNGNWQWVASTGVDYMFRVFNPWLQQRKFDPEAKYVKKWVEELREQRPEIIHEIYNHEVKGYPRPIVDYTEEVAKSREEYRRAREECSNF